MYKKNPLNQCFVIIILLQLIVIWKNTTRGHVRQVSDNLVWIFNDLTLRVSYRSIVSGVHYPSFILYLWWSINWRIYMIFSKKRMNRLLHTSSYNYFVHVQFVKIKYIVFKCFSCKLNPVIKKIRNNEKEFWFGLGN